MGGAGLSSVKKHLTVEILLLFSEHKNALSLPNVPKCHRVHSDNLSHCWEAKEHKASSCWLMSPSVVLEMIDSWLRSTLWVDSTVWRISWISVGHSLFIGSFTGVTSMSLALCTQTVFWWEFYQKQASDLWSMSVLQHGCRGRALFFVILLLFWYLARDWAQSLLMLISKHCHWPVPQQDLGFVDSQELKAPGHSPLEPFWDLDKYNERVLEYRSKRLTSQNKLWIKKSY